MSETSGDGTTGRAPERPATAAATSGNAGGTPPPHAPAASRGRAWRTWTAWGGAAAWGAFALLRWADGDRLPGLGVFAAPVLAVTPYVAASAPIPV
ncbi:hypothetical protein DZF91_27515, partial [Actinomadura logoneensis]